MQQNKQDRIIGLQSISWHTMFYFNLTEMCWSVWLEPLFCGKRQCLQWPRVDRKNPGGGGCLATEGHWYQACGHLSILLPFMPKVTERQKLISLTPKRARSPKIGLERGSLNQSFYPALPFSIKPYHTTCVCCCLIPNWWWDCVSVMLW